MNPDSSGVGWQKVELVWSDEIDISVSFTKGGVGTSVDVDGDDDSIYDSATVTLTCPSCGSQEEEE